MTDDNEKETGWGADEPTPEISMARSIGPQPGLLEIKDKASFATADTVIRSEGTA